ncbi:MAG TPA: CotH kinase family protein [Verrucomicrobiae bacterium]|nr:CotH kinase family protein [Verrucomicrobiae bacterium]
MAVFHVELDDFEAGQLARRPKAYVGGRVRIGEQVFENVGIRLKGSGTFQPISEHPSLAVKFNWKESNQRFSGLAKLFLENSAQDASKMCKFVANAVFADGGIPAPRITHARVFLNERDLGIYVVAEAINKDFLKHHFGDSSGNMYEAFFSDVGRGLKQDNGPLSDQWDLRELAAAAAIRDEAVRKQKLSQLLDVDEFLDFLAIETILANWDGYAYHQNNYRLYHDPVSGRIKIIPHDLDNTFSESGMSLMPPRNAILTSALLATQQDRDAFRERVARLFPRVLDAQHVQRRVGTCVARLSQGASPEEISRIQRQSELLEKRVQERWNHFGQELAGNHPPTPAFDSGGMARLTGWSAKTDWNNAIVKAVVDEDTPVLRIDASQNYCFGSWRLPLWLPPGRYRLEGEARTRGVVGLPSQTGSGAGVRVLGGRRGSGIQGNCGHWAQVRHDFVVQEDCEWVELIAELRATSGTAWFDPETLRLIRLR